MSWRVDREVLPDGTIVGRMTYERAPPRGNHYTDYLGVVTCPRCNRPGHLRANFIRHYVGGRWYGPYFHVRHATYFGKGHYRCRYCYFGRVYPRQMPREVRYPG